MGHLDARLVTYSTPYAQNVLTAAGRTLWDINGNPLDATPPPPPPPQTGTWLSGFSGDMGFGSYRGNSAEVRGDWNDATVAGQSNLWAIAPGGPHDINKWTGPLDLACGAIFAVANGAATNETWAAAATGAYDSRWTTCLTNAKNHWGTRTAANLHLRFAHEFNGEWYPWYVTEATAPDFILGWRRFHSIKQSIFPGCKLVWCSSTGRNSSWDVRKAFPGAAYVDVVSSDYYNQWPHVTNLTEFNAQATATRTDGGPIGIEAVRQFAQSVGLPYAISEWGNYGISRSVSQGGGGDTPAFMDLMYDWMDAHSGVGPGLLKYEIYFNVQNFGSGQFELWPNTVQPNAAARYVARF